MTMNDPNGPDIGHRAAIDRSSNGTIWVLAVVFVAVFVGMIAVYAMMEDRTTAADPADVTTGQSRPAPTPPANPAPRPQ